MIQFWLILVLEMTGNQIHFQVITSSVLNILPTPFTEQESWVSPLS